MTDGHKRKRSCSQGDLDQAHKRSFWQSYLQKKIAELIERQNNQDRSTGSPTSESLMSGFTQHIWPKIRDDYHKMTQYLENELKGILERLNIDAEVSSRVKEDVSIAKTLKRRQKGLLAHESNGFKSYQHIFDEMHDLSGLRIVLKYPDHLNEAQKQIEKLFKQQKLPAHFDPNREIGQFWKRPWFGAYETHNHRVQLSNDNRVTMGASHQYSGVMFEIQLTTFSDNLYNKLAHSLLYKADHGLVTEQEEMVIDVSHGLARCFELCMKILQPKLHRDINSRTIDTAEDISGHTKEEVKLAQSVVDRFERDLDDQTKSDRTAHLLRKLLSKNEDAEDQACLKDLLVSDPRDDKTRIEETKGGLLRRSYNWILEDQDFQRWREDGQNPPFWITGEPGKGKTMMLCGIINDLSTQSGRNVSYFFCQGTDKRINSGTAVLRGLLFLLCNQQHSLISYIRDKYDKAGGKLFEDANAWVSLSKILDKTLGDSGLRQTYLIVDALDECLEDSRGQLLKLVEQMSRAHPTVKWVVSSRKLEEFNTYLQKATHLSLESRRESVAAAVDAYIDSKLVKLREQCLGPSTVERIADELKEKSEGTFLWVAIVCKELESAQEYEVMDILQEMPTGLNQLYGKLVQDIKALKRKNPKYCQSVLRAVAVAFRPLKLDEIQQLAGLPQDVPAKTIANLCRSLLTVRKDTASFVHQSAKDFLSNEWDTVFQHRKQDTHKSMFSRSVEAMKRSLRQNIYSLDRHDLFLESYQRPSPDPLAPIQYSCVYWISHLREAPRGSAKDEVDGFFRDHFLHWFEALSLIGSASTVVRALRDLIPLCFQGGLEPLLPLVRDMHRFAQSNMAIIENAPLQVYLSALIFSPTCSLIRILFTLKEPEWIVQKPRVEQHWSSYLTTSMNLHSPVCSVALSPDTHHVVCGLYDSTIQIRDAESGAAILTLQGHAQPVWSVAFDDEGNFLTSKSEDLIIKIWDLKDGSCISTSESSSQLPKSWVFSPDKSCYATCFPYSDVIRIMDSRTDKEVLALRGHSDKVTSMAFSCDGLLLASGSNDGTVKIWDAATGHENAILPAYNRSIMSLCFSPDSHRIAHGSEDGTIVTREIGSRAQFSTLQGQHGHREAVISVDSTLDGRRIASGSFDKTVKIWDTETGHNVRTIEYGFAPSRVAFSPDGRHIIAADTQFHKTLVISDAESGTMISTWRQDCENTLALSPDGRYIAAGSGRYIVTWDVKDKDGKIASRFIGHSDTVTCLTFSPKNCQIVASASVDQTIRIWNVVAGVGLSSLYVGSDFSLLRFDATGACLHTNSLVVPIRDPTWSINPTPLQAEIVLPQLRHYRFAVSEDCSWITWYGRNVLWIPPKFRGRKRGLVRSFSILPHMISMGCSSGRVWWVTFSFKHHPFAI